MSSLLLTSIFSAGNTYCYCAMRTLYGLALEGRAPKVLTYTTKKGVPIYCFLVVMIFPMLSFLQVSNNSSIVIGWFASLVTAGGMSHHPHSKSIRSLLPLQVSSTTSPSPSPTSSSTAPARPKVSTVAPSATSPASSPGLPGSHSCG